MPSWKVNLSDGRTLLVHSLTELSSDQIKQAALGGETKPPAPPYGSGAEKFLSRMGGAVAGEMTMGAPLGAAGAEIGGALGTFGGPFAPVTIPVGAALGGAVGTGAGAFLGSFAADRARQLLQNKATGSTTPLSESAKAAAPYGTFGIGEGLVGAGLKAAAPILKNAPRAIQMFTRSGTIANRVAESAGGGFTAGTTAGLAQGEPLKTAVGEGLQQAPVAGLIGGALQTVPSFLRTRSGKSVNEAGANVMTEADRLVQAQRTGPLPKYLAERGHQIFDQITNVVVSDKTPIPLGDFVKQAEDAYGTGSPQVETLLSAFGRSKRQVMGDMNSAAGLNAIGLKTSGPIPMPTKPFEQAQFSSGSVINADQPGQLAEIFKSEPIDPQRALDTATALGGKVRGGAKAGFKRGYSSADAINADARGVIYAVLKKRAGAEGEKTINNALQQYGEFATSRNQVIAKLSPFGNPQTPTAPGIQFLTRVASGKQTLHTPDDQRLITFLKEATGGDPAAGLNELIQTLERAKSQHDATRVVQNWVTRIGIAYPAIRTIFRPK